MKTPVFRPSAALALGLTLALSPLAWAAPAAVEAPQGASSASSGQALTLSSSEVRLDGDSTLHPFHAVASDVKVTASFDSKALPKASPYAAALVKAGGVKSLNVEIPVVGLKSGESGLDKNMAKALKAADAPNITFSMDSYTIQAGDKGDQIVAKGKLSVAGKPQAVELKAAVTWTALGLDLKGDQEVLMTAHGIDPPQMMMGMVKTKDKIVIHYHLVLALPEPTVVKAEASPAPVAKKAKAAKKL